MGRTSEELEALRHEKTFEEGVDYWLKKVKRGDWADAGWVHTAENKRYINTRLIGLLIKNKNRPQPREMAHYNAWYIYLGPRPNKKWGPVCP